MFRSKFQSTPPRGRRRLCAKSELPAICFNPRLREGGDDDAPIDLSLRVVSIHASAREATPRHATPPSICLFQSTPPRGRRLYIGGFFNSINGFQSTPPRGRRLRDGIAPIFIHVFQSTPPRGRRLSSGYRLPTHSKFQSTPPRGRRHGHVANAYSGYVSIHASAREATCATAIVLPCALSFNPRLREGGDIRLRRIDFRYCVSIHASAREATLSICHGLAKAEFQSTPPRGRRQL